MISPILNVGGIIPWAGSLDLKGREGAEHQRSPLCLLTGWNVTSRLPGLPLSLPTEMDGARKLGARTNLLPSVAVIRHDPGLPYNSRILPTDLLLPRGPALLWLEFGMPPTGSCV